jgi:hypothetical protein
MVGAALSQEMHRLIKLLNCDIIRLPNSIKEALALDRDNGNHLWDDAIMKEGSGVRIAFKPKEDGKPPPGYKEAKLMIIFDIKMDFTRKTRLVA